MGNLRWFKMNPAAWLCHPKLSKCSPGARGIFLDIYCLIRGDPKLEKLGITGELKPLSKFLRCSQSDLLDALLALTDHGIIECKRVCPPGGMFDKDYVYTIKIKIKFDENGGA